ncbi:MAG: ribonuclease Z [Candidatus Omnitrophota bacterium]|nr:MAG: ribonuclease Z [Candidatus Omnitrophota bacterium]
MARIVFLGTASSIPTRTRDNTSFLLTHMNKTFLVDCPGSVVHKLLKIGADFKKLRNVIITHQHPDHIYGIISLVHTQCYLNDKLNIFSNTYTIRIIKKLVKIFGLGKKPYPALRYINVFTKHSFYSQKGLSLKAIHNVYIQGSFGIKCTFGKKSLLYTSDTSFSRKMLKAAGKVNYLIHDCTASSLYFKKHPSLYRMHTHALSLTEYLKDKPTIKLIPIHFLLLKKEEEDRIKKELSPLRKHLVFVKDFQTLVL